MVLNLIGFYIMGRDKRLAKKHKHRVAERDLWWIAFLGGAAGMTAGMRFYRHKTKHFQFSAGLPILALLQAAGFVYFFKILT